MAEPGWPARDAGAQWRGHVAGGHATTQVHVGARVGRHVSRSREETLGQLIGESSPLFNRVLPLYFFRVGLYSHTVLTLQATWMRDERRISSWTATIAWTRVHAISDSGTCRKYKGKWPDLRTYLTTHGKFSVVRSSSSLIHRRSGSWTSSNARTAVMHRDISNLSSDDGRSSQKWITIRSSSDGRRSMTKNYDRSPIVTRSRRDRSSIVPRLDLLSSRNHSNLRRRRPTEIQDHDRRSIVA